MTGRAGHWLSGFVLLLWVLLALYILKGRDLATQVILVSIMVGSFLLNSLLKAVVREERPRPIDEFSRRFHIGVQKLSFPSCHAQMSFTAYALAGGVMSGIAPPVLFLAVLTSILRLVLGRHRARDVLAGAAVGYGYGWACIFLWRA
jgi:undecaprenyl-diphosphatase